MVFNLNTKDKLVKTRIKLMEKNPFFSFLALNLNLVEDKNIDSCGVDVKGNLYYNPNWIDEVYSHSYNILMTVLIHEVLHLVLLHHERAKNYVNKEVCNTAMDLAVNNILVSNSFEFGYLINYSPVPSGNQWGDIEDIDKKTFEIIYEELLKNKPKGDDKKGFDKHDLMFNGDKKLGNGLEQEVKQDSKDFRDLLAQAITHAKSIGKMPNGMDRIINELIHGKVNWKTLLYKYIVQSCFSDYSWNRPHKKSLSCGVYLPSATNESIELIVSIDTSGSISEKTLKEFLGEIVNIVSSYNEVNATLLICDCQISKVISVNSHDIGSLISDIGKSLKGGGGTDHVCIFEWIKKNKPDTTLLIALTDGYTSFPKSDYDWLDTVWVLTEGSCNKSNIPFGDVIKIE